MTEPDVYVIWSFEHRAWWAPNRQGYEVDLERAGRYAKAEAALIVLDANIVQIEEYALPLEMARRIGPPPNQRVRGNVV